MAAKKKPSKRAVRDPKTKVASKKSKAAKSKAKVHKKSKRALSANKIVGSRVFKRAEKQAEDYLASPQNAARLASKANAKLRKHGADVKDVADGLQALIRMIRAFARGDYREIPWTTMVAATATVVYFVNPLDLIPDTIPVAGYIDDAALVAFVIAAIQTDLDAFLGWEART